MNFDIPKITHWTTARGDRLTIRAMPKNHLINALRMMVRMGRGFVFPDESGETDWRQYVPVAYYALRAEARRRHIPETDWTQGEATDISWPHGRDLTVRDRLVVKLQATAPSRERLACVLHDAAVTIRSQTSADREVHVVEEFDGTIAGAFRYDINGDDTVDPPPLAATAAHIRPILLEESHA